MALGERVETYHVEGMVTLAEHCSNVSEVTM